MKTTMKARALTRTVTSNSSQPASTTDYPNGYDILLNELDASNLEVVLVPCRTYVNAGGCIRATASVNARWYREFCARHPSSRRRANALPDTRIRRRDIIRLLPRLGEGLPSLPKYERELRRLAAQALARHVEKIWCAYHSDGNPWEAAAIVVFFTPVVLILAVACIMDRLDY